MAEWRHENFQQSHELVRHCFSHIAFGGLGCATAQTQTNTLRVGIYDSRAVAVAYANSTEFKNAMKSIEADHKKARQTKNEKRANEIGSQMQSQQRRAHEQAFSTGSAAPIMAEVKDPLPDVAKQPACSSL